MTVKELLNTVKNSCVTIDGYLDVHFCEEIYDYQSPIFQENVTSVYVKDNVLHIVPREKIYIQKE